MDEEKMEIMEQDESGTDEAPPKDTMLEDNHSDPDMLRAVRDWSPEIASLGARIDSLDRAMQVVQKAIMDSRTTTEVEDVDEAENVIKSVDDLFEYED